jgi:hypothetical protein
VLYFLEEGKTRFKYIFLLLLIIIQVHFHSRYLKIFIKQLNSFHAIDRFAETITCNRQVSKIKINEKRGVETLYIYHIKLIVIKLCYQRIDLFIECRRTVESMRPVILFMASINLENIMRQFIFSSGLI